MELPTCQCEWPKKPEWVKDINGWTALHLSANLLRLKGQTLCDSCILSQTQTFHVPDSLVDVEPLLITGRLVCSSTLVDSCSNIWWRASRNLICILTSWANKQSVQSIWRQWGESLHLDLLALNMSNLLFGFARHCQERTRVGVNGRPAGWTCPTWTYRRSSASLAILFIPPWNIPESGGLCL